LVGFEFEFRRSSGLRTPPCAIRPERPLVKEQETVPKWITDRASPRGGHRPTPRQGAEHPQQRDAGRAPERGAIGCQNGPKRAKRCHVLARKFRNGPILDRFRSVFQSAFHPSTRNRRGASLGISLKALLGLFWSSLVQFGLLGFSPSRILSLRLRVPSSAPPLAGAVGGQKGWNGLPARFGRLPAGR
jgi:hypothetical protein